MGRYFLMTILGLIYCINLSAQDKEIDKLIFLYVDEKYEKCVDKGISLTEDDNYRKEPLPYLYVSMAYYEIAKTDELQEKYPKAFKDAMKYAYKYRKKDKNLEYAGKYKDYFITLKDSANSLAQLYYKTEDYRKAAYTYEQIVRFDPDAYLMQLWQGVAEIKSRNIGEGERNLNMAMEHLNDSYKPDKIEASIATQGFNEYADYMESKGDMAAAKKGRKLAEKFKDYDPEVIKQREAEAAKKNEPVREVKKFETTEEEAQKQKTKFANPEKKEGVEDAKSEIEKITEEQKSGSNNERKVKSFSSDKDEEE